MSLPGVREVIHRELQDYPQACVDYVIADIDYITGKGKLKDEIRKLIVRELKDVDEDWLNENTTIKSAINKAIKFLNK